MRIVHVNRLPLYIMPRVYTHICATGIFDLVLIFRSFLPTMAKSNPAPLFFTLIFFHPLPRCFPSSENTSDTPPPQKKTNKQKKDLQLEPPAITSLLPLTPKTPSSSTPNSHHTHTNTDATILFNSALLLLLHHSSSFPFVPPAFLRNRCSGGSRM